MLSPPDLLIIGAAALIFFGPDQLPKVARRAGQVVRDVQNTSQSFIREMERAGEAEDRHTESETQPYEYRSYAEPTPAPAQDLSPPFAYATMNVEPTTSSENPVSEPPPQTPSMFDPIAGAPRSAETPLETHSIDPIPARSETHGDAPENKPDAPLSADHRPTGTI